MQKVNEKSWIGYGDGIDTGWGDGISEEDWGFGSPVQSSTIDGGYTGP